MKQSEIVQVSEGDAWWARNKDKSRDGDPVLRAIEQNQKLKRLVSVLEIGCGNGWRLRELYKQDRDTIYSGCDLSWEAIDDGRAKSSKINLRVAAADNLGYMDNSFDLVILGFFMYLVDREDLFRVVMEADRVLMDKGALIIHDFSSEVPHSRAYHHDHRLRTFKMDHHKLFTANPTYSVESVFMEGGGDDAVSVVTLRKNIELGWPPKV